MNVRHITSRLVPKGITLALGCIAFVHVLQAASTGKIAGRVIDGETGVPLPAVNIMIEGTTRGAATNTNGEYFILNLPPRTYSVRATMMGYIPLVKTDVVVSQDHTTPLDFRLEQTVLEAAEAVIVTAEREVIRMDMSSASHTVATENIENTAYGGTFDQVFMTQPGWGDWFTPSSQALEYDANKFGVRAATSEDQGFEVRGGGESQVNLMVDGMSLKDMTSGYQFTKLNLNNIQEVQLLTGGFSAEYGEARSGVIKVVTKEGGEKFAASVDIKASPPDLKHFGPAINDTTACVYNYDYGAHLGFGSYWDADSKKVVSLAGTAYTGNRFFPGWIATVGGIPAGHPWYPLLQNKTHEDTMRVANFIREEWLWKYRPELWEYGDAWDYDIEATLSGPVPLVKPIAGRTTFFASYRTKYSEWMYPRSGGREGGYNDYTFQLKVTSHPFTNIKLWYTGLWSVRWGGFEYRTDLENFAFGHVLETPLQEFNQLERGDFAEWWRMPEHNGKWMKPTDRRDHSFNSVNLSWVPTPETMFELSVQYARHWNTLIQAEVRDTTLIPDEPWEDLDLDGEWDVGEPYTDSNGDGAWTPGVYAKRIGMPGHWKYYDEAPWGRLPHISTQLGAIPNQNWQDDSFSEVWTTKASVRSQIGMHHQVKAGIDVIASHEYLFRLKPKQGGFVWYFDARPLRISGYVEDKLEFKGMIATLGVRVDGFDPEDSYYDIGSDPFNPLFGRGGPGNPLVQSREDSLARIVRLGRGNLALDMIPDSLLFDPPWQVNWSPRLGISHPISDRAKIFFNYGHAYQPPRSIHLFALNQRCSEEWSLRTAGNPRLKMEKTIAWEVGYEHNILDKYRLAISGYYRYTGDEVSTFQYYGNSSNNVKMYLPQNYGYNDIRGLDLKLEKRAGRFLTGWLSYDYNLRSTGRTGYSYEYQQGYSSYLSEADNGVYVDAPYDSVLRERSNRSQTVYPSRSRVRINLDFHTPSRFGPRFLGLYPLGEWRANFMYVWNEGATFTYNPEGKFYVQENMQWMGFRQTDMKLTKRMGLAHVEVTFYMEVYNLFNTKNFNMINYFGSPTADGAPFPAGQAVYYDSIIEQGYQVGETDKKGIHLPYGPEYALFFPKRDVYFGLKVSLR